MKIFLDSNPVNYPTDSLLEPKFTIRRKNDEGEFSVSFTGDLDFTGADYDYLYAKLVAAPNAINNSVVLTFVDDCCSNKEYPFLIKPESLKWCVGKCELQATAVEYTPDAKAYACIENTLIWDNYNGFQNRAHPRVKYCLEYRPSLLQDLMIILGILTVSMIGTLIPVIAIVLLVVGTINSTITVINMIIGVINNVITAINTLPGISIPTINQSMNTITIAGFDDPLEIFRWGLDLFEKVNGLISGCGFEHPSPLVRSYIDNVCNKCGVSFQSGILNEPSPSKPNHDYYNLVYFNAPIKAGRIDIPYFAKPLVPYIEDNKPIHNLKSFLDEVAQPFNAAWDISNSILRFERVDYFKNQIPWFDVTTYPTEMVISECYEWAKKRRPAYANIGYQRDAVDWCGSEANNLWSDIVEWNNPVNPIQKGEFTKLFNFSTARFRGDAIERDVLSNYRWAPFGIGQNIKENEDVMIMNSGTSFSPKLLIWDGNDINHALIRRYAISAYNTDQFNYPMWVDADRPGNLYDRFWQIENPRNASFSGYDFTISIVWNCETLNAVNINGNVLTSKGLSKTIVSVDLDFTTKTIIIRGTV